MDDLCWSGKHWLIQSDTQVKSIAYLTLQPNSWVSRHACLLHFTSEQQSYTWLFTRRGMGQRTYSELCYLAKQDLAATTS